MTRFGIDGRWSVRILAGTTAVIFTCWPFLEAKAAEKGSWSVKIDPNDKNAGYIAPRGNNYSTIMLSCDKGRSGIISVVALMSPENVIAGDKRIIRLGMSGKSRQLAGLVEEGPDGYNVAAVLPSGDPLFRELARADRLTVGVDGVKGTIPMQGAHASVTALLRSCGRRGR